MSKRKILITGGCGFIGQALLRLMIDGDWQPTVYDNLSPQIHGSDASMTSFAAAFPHARFVRGDVRDATALAGEAANADAIVHLAAETGTGQSMYEIGHYYDVNVRGTAELFQAVARHAPRVKTLILASSRAVYGEGAYLCAGKCITPPARTLEQLRAKDWEPVGPAGELLTLMATPEEADLRPSSFYAASKVAMESMSQVFALAYDRRVICLRFQNIFGEGQSLKNPYTGILSIFSNRMRQNLPIDIYEDGMESRDFLHVDDAAHAIIKSLRLEGSGLTNINVGSGVATSVLEVAQRLKEAFHSSSELHVSGRYRVGDIRHCYADLHKANDILAFTPGVSFNQGLERFVHWVSTQPVETVDVLAERERLGQLGLGMASDS